MLPLRIFGLGHPWGERYPKDWGIVRGVGELFGDRGKEVRQTLERVSEWRYCHQSQSKQYPKVLLKQFGSSYHGNRLSSNLADQGSSTLLLRFPVTFLATQEFLLSARAFHRCSWVTAADRM